MYLVNSLPHKLPVSRATPTPVTHSLKSLTRHEGRTAAEDVVDVGSGTGDGDAW